MTRIEADIAYTFYIAAKAKYDEKRMYGYDEETAIRQSCIEIANLQNRTKMDIFAITESLKNMNIGLRMGNFAGTNGLSVRFDNYNKSLKEFKQFIKNKTQL